MEHNDLRSSGLRKALRILVVVAITLAVIGIGVPLVAPIALSIWSKWKAPKNANLVPQNLRDLAISQAEGRKLTYFGYEFEVPWNDLDETQTKLAPKENPCNVVLTFRSGLRLMVTAVPAREWANRLPATFKTSPQGIETIFGHEAMQSDYSFVKQLYEFTPDKMHTWSTSPVVHYRENFVLMVKSVTLSRSANSGIFNVHNGSYVGFQQGDTHARQDGIVFSLYSDEGGIDFIFSQEDYNNPAGISQPEINRIVQSLRRVSRAESFRSTPDRHTTS